ncbi:MAG: hypothetical protein KDA27_24540 [Candidatus Eisenbacteria bacterium]|uniref:Uncharacterized protein n=1 Tax=Eiseniibacteriota bacterium TaxID=2212470 RepID=A0A956NKW1_UNCEI|nr:hypothetical protein [Candidatus Eisenbacteria bacterium]
MSRRSGQHALPVHHLPPVRRALPVPRALPVSRARPVHHALSLHLKMPLLCAFLVPVVLTSIDLPTASAECAAWSDTPHFVYHVPHTGVSPDAIVHGNTAWISSGSDIVAFDVTDPESPSVLWEVEASGTPSRLAYSDGLLYVSESSAIEVYDVSTQAVHAWGLVPGSHPIRDLEVVGDQIYNVSQFQFAISQLSPPSVSTIGSVPLPTYGWSFAVDGDFAYVTLRDSGITVIDVSVPTNPARLGTFPMPGPSWEIVLDGTYGFVAAGDAGLLSLDLADPVAPVVVSQVPAGTAVGVRIQGTELFVRSDQGDVFVFDVTDPTTPTLARGLGVTANLGYSIDGPYIYSGQRGLRVYQHDGLHSVPTLGSISGDDDIAGYAVAGSMVCVMTNDFVVYDATDPAHPFERGRIDGTLPFFTAELQTAGYGDYVYVVFQDDNGFLVFHAYDVTDPDHPALVTEIPAAGVFGGYPLGVKVVGDRMYARVDGKIVSLALDSPTFPGQIASVAPPQDAEEFAGDGDRAVVIGDYWNGSSFDAYFGVLDLDPLTPGVLSWIDLGVDFTDDVVLRGDRAYVFGESEPDGLSYVVTIGLDDPTSPVILDVSPGARGPVQYVGDSLLQAGGADGIRLYDLVDLDHPASTSGWNPPGSSDTFFVGDGIIASWGGGPVHVTRLPCDPSGIQVPEDGLRPALSAAPNPFRDETAIFGGLGVGVRVAIFDTAGRRLRTLGPVDSPGSAPGAEARTLRWDGLDSSRRPVPAGMYWAVAEGPQVRLGSAKALRIVRVR